MSDGTAAIGARVVVAVYEHRHGHDVRAFQGEARALEWRREIAEQWWDDEFDQDPPTTGDIGAAYFADIEGESFSVHAVLVEGE